MVADFEMDRAGMRQVARGQELRGSVRQIILRARAYAESIAPRRTGAYASSFEIRYSRITIRGMRRIAARLVNTDPQAALIEWGSKRTPAHRTLTRTLRWLGGNTTHMGFLGAPSIQTGAPRRLAVGAPAAQPIPTLDEFRAEQQRRRERDREYRRRRRRRRAGGD